MRILVACEESQTLTTAFRELGLEAFSCDILPTSGKFPHWHLQQDVRPLLQDEWALIVAFPPCTHLAISGARWFPQKQANGSQQAAIDFFLNLANSPCPKIAIENPVGIMSSHYRKPDQIIQPYHFGEPYEKRTCLWLKNLPLLKPTNVVAPPARQRCKNGQTLPTWYSNASKKSRATIRGKTFEGIAEAMAKQWGETLY